MDIKVLKILDKISPSRLTSIKQCALRVVLAETYDNPLLPYPPASHLGNVIHECIRLIFIGEICTGEDFNLEWDRLVAIEEKRLEEIGFEFLIPLNKNVKNYSIKKLQVKELIAGKDHRKNVIEESCVKFFHEEWLNSKDRLIVGRVDLIIQIDEFVKLSDFKSGRILEEEGDIKQDYEEQIKLYGYLYSEVKNRYPDELSLIDLWQNEYNIEFTKEGCNQIAEEAKLILKETNTRIRQGESDKLANASLDICRFCLYKPACKYHWALYETDDHMPFTSIQGLLLDVKKFANGNINAYIRQVDKEMIISKLNPNAMQRLIKNKGNTVAFYNLLRGDTQGRYKALRTTMIYAE